ncbi:MAG TPA: hypothetical protein VFS34_14450 [Thermoanaerobaculia bacterium]|nr:hypothetical protein [Thermoanaerobaculia bacterium]
MKTVVSLALSLALASSAGAAMKEVNGHWVHEYPTKGRALLHTASASNMSYHGGNILPAAKVVPIFWGSYWGTSTGSSQRSAMSLFFQQFGTNAHYGVITQYYDTTTGSTRYIGLSALLATGSTGWSDTTNPSSSRVTDAMVEAEVDKYLGSHAFNGQSIYEVFIGPGYYSYDGGATSCGGGNLRYCAYHGAYSWNGHTVKYSIEPYPSCSGCHAYGFTTAQDMQHFACHETREAVTDPVNAWWNGSTGYEADDQCAWSPAPFTDGGYGYQYEWSNRNGGCVR